MGDRFAIGAEVMLEITPIGKDYHNAGCAIKKASGDCIMPREGSFAWVTRGGTIQKKRRHHAIFP